MSFRCSRYSLLLGVSLECWMALILLFLFANSEMATFFPLEVTRRRFAPPRHHYHIRRHDDDDARTTKSSRLPTHISSTPPHTNSETGMLPYQVTVSETETSNSKLKPSSWIQEAAQTLRCNGVCALVSSTTTMTLPTKNNSKNTSLIPHSDCVRANDAAASRLSHLQRKIRNRGIDQINDRPFQFQEVVCRDERRYDMSVPWNSADVNVNVEPARPYTCHCPASDQ
jgi:hypothetical protein